MTGNGKKMVKDTQNQTMTFDSTGIILYNVTMKMTSLVIVACLSPLYTLCCKSIGVIVLIRNRSLYIRTAVISVIIYNDCYSWFIYIMANFFQSVYIMTEILVCL